MQISYWNYPLPHKLPSGDWFDLKAAVQCYLRTSYDHDPKSGPPFFLDSVSLDSTHSDGTHVPVVS